MRSPLSSTRRAALALAAAVAFVAPAATGLPCSPAAGAETRYPGSFAVSDDAGRQGGSPGKDALHRLQIVANLQAAPPDRPVVLLLGGSSARECTVDDRVWAAEIEALGGPPVIAYNFGCRHDTYALDREIARLLPEDMPAIVYIGINIGRFANAPASPKVQLPGPLIPPPAYAQHVYSIDKRVQSAATKRSYVDYWRKVRWPRFRARYQYNIGVLESVVRECLARGLRPVLVDLPRDLAIIGRSLDEPVATYKAGCKRISTKYRIPWLTFVRSAGLKSGDFFDLFHLVEPGRVKYQRLLSQKTVHLLEKYGLDTPQPTPTPTPTSTRRRSLASRPARRRDRDDRAHTAQP